MNRWEWAALIAAAMLGLFCVWVAVAVIWADRPPVVRDDKTGRYKSARMTKQKRVGR